MLTINARLVHHHCQAAAEYRKLLRGLARILCCIRPCGWVKFLTEGLQVGAGTQITPPIAPGSSFIAQIVPPRAGTFIYHTHWHDPSQLTNGLYGPLIVLSEGETFDPKSDLTFVFSIGGFGALQELALINGTPQSKTLQLQTGRKYRFRFINISTNNQGMQVSLRNASGPVEWVTLAKDGADLPTHVSTRAQATITVGETFDVEFSSASAQDLLLDLLLPGQKIHTTQTLSFQPI